MTRTAREVLQLIEHVLDGPGAAAGDVGAIMIGEAQTLRDAVGEGLADLDERPQPEPLGTVKEALGGILDIATRLIPGNSLTVERVDAARDRLVKLVEIGLADLGARPQDTRPEPAPDGLDMWQRKDAVELAIRWFEIEAGPSVLSKVAQIVQIFRGEKPTTPAPPPAEPPVVANPLEALAESWMEIAAEEGTGEYSAFVYRKCARQLYRLLGIERG